MKSSFTLTIEVDAAKSWSRCSSTNNCDSLAQAMEIALHEKEYNANKIRAAHLLVCSAVGLAMSAGVGPETLLALPLKDPTIP